MLKLTKLEEITEEPSLEDSVIQIQIYNKYQHGTRNLDQLIRSLFIPEEGHTWGCFDYSQQEPRLVVHYATLQNLYGVDDVLEAI